MSKKKESLEIVSLNHELITFDADDISLEVLERRLELAAFVCGTFVCSDFGSCGAFGCGTFKMMMAE